MKNLLIGAFGAIAGSLIVAWVTGAWSPAETIEKIFFSGSAYEVEEYKKAREVAKKLSSTAQDEAKKQTSRAVCDHCFRSFGNIEKAEEHELTCDRNPDGNAIVCPYHLSSVYRDIRPPPPMTVNCSPDTENRMV